MWKPIVQKPSVRPFTELSRQERWFLVTSAIVSFLGQALFLYPRQLDKARQVLKVYRVGARSAYRTSETSYEFSLYGIVVKPDGEVYKPTFSLKVEKSCLHFNYSCSCPDAGYRPERPCKHTLALVLKAHEKLFGCTERLT